MIYRFILSGENLKLSKAEVEALFNCKVKLNEKVASITTDLSQKEVIQLCNRSAMIKECSNNKVVWKVKKGRFEGRHPKIAFHPTALKPKLARLLVNLSKADEKGLFLDPFCGSGSIVLESSLLGISSMGNDLDPTMCKLAETNLKHYKAENWQILKGDATELHKVFKKNSISAIATDTPYGKSSKVISKDLKTLYSGFIKSAYVILKPKSRLVIVTPDWIRINNYKFKRISQFKLYVHKTLTRIISVLEKC